MNLIRKNNKFFERVFRASKIFASELGELKLESVNRSINLLEGRRWIVANLSRIVLHSEIKCGSRIRVYRLVVSALSASVILCASLSRDVGGSLVRMNLNVTVITMTVIAIYHP